VLGFWLLGVARYKPLKGNAQMSIQEKTQAVAEALAELVKAVALAAIKGANGNADAAAETPAPAAGKKRRKAAAPAVTVEEVRASLIALNEAKGKQAVIDLLARYGVGKIGDLAEENYAEAKTEAESEAMAEDDAEGEGGDDDMFS